MLMNTVEYKSQLDAMMGYKDTVTDHTTIGVLQFMAYKNDYANYQNRLMELKRNKK